MARDRQRKSADKVLMDKENADQSAEATELTLPEKLCRFYVERPKLAFGMFVYKYFLAQTCLSLCLSI